MSGGVRLAAGCGRASNVSGPVRRPRLADWALIGPHPHPHPPPWAKIAGATMPMDPGLTALPDHGDGHRWTVSVRCRFR